jgi:hypothetical protein
MQPLEAMLQMAKIAKADGLYVYVQPGPMSSYHGDRIAVARDNPPLGQMVAMSHELGHHFDFKVDPLNHSEDLFKNSPFFRSHPHAHSIVLYREKRAWMIGEEILQNMGVIDNPRELNIFSRIKEACLNTYIARADGCSPSELRYLANKALFVLTNPEKL